MKIAKSGTQICAAFCTIIFHLLLWSCVFVLLYSLIPTHKFVCADFEIEVSSSFALLIGLSDFVVLNDYFVPVFLVLLLAIDFAALNRFADRNAATQLWSLLMTALPIGLIWFGLVAISAEWTTMAVKFSLEHPISN